MAEIKDNKTQFTKLHRVACFTDLINSKTIESAQTILEVVTEVSDYISEFLDKEYSEIETIDNFKSSSESLKHRTDGNVKFALKELLKSLECYDDSIAHAPFNSRETSLSFANRSAVLLEMGKLNECVSEIHRALECGYPENLKYKLLLREGQCLRDTGHTKKAQGLFNKALELSQNSSELSEKTKVEVKNKIMIEKQMKARKVKESHKMYNPTQLPTLAYGPSKDIPCVSSALKLCYDQSCGRHYVATRDIKIGDVVLVEEPYVCQQPDSNRNDLHACSHCQSICFTLLPCPNCTWAMFCSENCMTEAADYHGIECPIVSRFILISEGHYEMLLGVMLVRCILKVGLENIDKYLDTVPTTQHTKGFNSNGVYDSSDFLTVMNLETNFSKLTPMEKLTNCVIALEVSKCFDPKNYLNCKKFTVLLFQLCTSIRFNALGNRSLKYQNGCLHVNIITSGGAIYPALSLFNNSCHPNLYPVFYGNKVTLRAKMPIAKNQQVTISYIGTWLECDDSLTRQKDLQDKYKFKCTCVGCLNNWSNKDTYKNLTDEEMLIDFPKSSNVFMKLNELSKKNRQFFHNFDPSLKNRKPFTNFVNQALKETSDLLTLFYRHNKIVYSDFYTLNQFLEVLFRSHGTTITNMGDFCEYCSGHDQNASALFEL